MKKIFILITIIFINFSVSANDIKNFEIGPVSLGQSLLDYTDKDQIKFLKKGENSKLIEIPAFVA